MIKYKSIKQMLQDLGGRRKMSQMEQMNQAKETVIEALKNYPAAVPIPTAYILLLPNSR